LPITIVKLLIVIGAIIATLEFFHQPLFFHGTAFCGFGRFGHKSPPPFLTIYKNGSTNYSARINIKIVLSDFKDHYVLSTPAIAIFQGGVIKLTLLSGKSIKSSPKSIF